MNFFKVFFFPVLALKLSDKRMRGALKWARGEFIPNIAWEYFFFFPFETGEFQNMHACMTGAMATSPYAMTLSCCSPQALFQ